MLFDSCGIIVAQCEKSRDNENLLCVETAVKANEAVLRALQGTEAEKADQMAALWAEVEDAASKWFQHKVKLGFGTAQHLGNFFLGVFAWYRSGGLVPII